MSVGYTWVQWSRHKRIYDGLMAAAAVAYIGIFFGATKLLWTGENAYSDEIVLIRATGSCAIILLHVILCIGPLARLDRRVLPLLYNRRHLGVMTFLIALIHATVVLGFYNGFGVVNPFISLLTSNTNYTSQLDKLTKQRAKLQAKIAKAKNPVRKQNLQTELKAVQDQINTVSQEKRDDIQVANNKYDDQVEQTKETYDQRIEQATQQADTRIQNLQQRLRELYQSAKQNAQTRRANAFAEVKTVYDRGVGYINEMQPSGNGEQNQ